MWQRVGAAVVPPPGANMLSLGFGDLAIIVDGKADDDVSMKPFTKTFTWDKILGTWAKLGFVQFTRNFLKDKKVWDELGQTHVNVDIETLHGNYVDLVALAENHGLNQGIFDATLPVAIRLERVADEDQQVRQLLAQSLRYGMYAVQELGILVWCSKPRANKLRSIWQKLYARQNGATGKAFIQHSDSWGEVWCIAGQGLGWDSQVGTPRGQIGSAHARFKKRCYHRKIGHMPYAPGNQFCLVNL
jgi:hypothetical protein